MLTNDFITRLSGPRHAR